MKGINSYFQEEVFSCLPKREIIECMHKNVEDTNESNKVSMLLKKIFTYIKEERKKKDKGTEKDMFLN